MRASTIVCMRPTLALHGANRPMEGSAPEQLHSGRGDPGRAQACNSRAHALNTAVSDFAVSAGEAALAAPGGWSVQGMTHGPSVGPVGCHGLPCNSIAVPYGRGFWQ